VEKKIKMLTPLMIACKNGDKEMVEKICNDDISQLNIVNDANYNALYFACANFQHDIVRYIYSITHNHDSNENIINIYMFYQLYKKYTKLKYGHIYCNFSMDKIDKIEKINEMCKRNEIINNIVMMIELLCELDNRCEMQITKYNKLRINFLTKNELYAKNNRL
jgi:ankyrin repeat protein